MSRREAEIIEEHFMFWHNSPPPPFNKPSDEETRVIETFEKQMAELNSRYERQLAEYNLDLTS